MACDKVCGQVAQLATHSGGIFIISSSSFRSTMWVVVGFMDIGITVRVQGGLVLEDIVKLGQLGIHHCSWVPNLGTPVPQCWWDTLHEPEGAVIEWIIRSRLYIFCLWAFPHFSATPLLAFTQQVDQVTAYVVSGNFSKVLNVAAIVTHQSLEGLYFCQAAGHWPVHCGLDLARIWCHLPCADHMIQVVDLLSTYLTLGWLQFQPKICEMGEHCIQMG